MSPPSHNVGGSRSPFSVYSPSAGPTKRKNTQEPASPMHENHAACVALRVPRHSHGVVVQLVCKLIQSISNMVSITAGRKLAARN